MFTVRPQPHHQPIQGRTPGLRPLPQQQGLKINFSKDFLGARDGTGLRGKGIGSLSWWVAESGLPGG